MHTRRAVKTLEDQPSNRPFKGRWTSKTDNIRETVNPLTGTLNRTATDRYTAVQRGGAWAGWGPVQSPPRCTKCNSPPINGQCTNFIWFDVAL